MPYTTSTTDFNPTLNELMEEAFERCGLELRTGYDFQTARRSLNFLTTEWANRGINLWTIEQGQIPLIQGQYVYDLPNDTIDLLEHVIRTNPGQVGNQTDINISRISVSTYSTIPNKLTQGRPIQVWVQRLTGGISPTGIVLAAYYNGGNTIAVDSTVGLPNAGFVQLTFGSSGNTGIFSYTGIQNATDTTPAYLLNVGITPNSYVQFSPGDSVALVQQPSINVWPSPDQGTVSSPYYYFVYWRLRRMVDAGTGANVEDIPFRFQNALVAGLAYMIAAKKMDVPMERIAMLKAQYDEAWDFASAEDREKAPDRFVPRTTFYR